MVTERAVMRCGEACVVSPKVCPHAGCSQEAFPGTITDSMLHASCLPTDDLCPVRDAIFRFFAAPLAALFGIGVEVRLLLYRFGVLRRASFSLPTIGVGNLSLGGAGKTPHTEYLLRTLAPYFAMGTLSRGYGRKTSGFRLVQQQDAAVDVGDEPLQLKRKFPDVAVCVAEDRVFGVSNLLQYAPRTKAIVLDDAFQHLAVRPSLNLLLTEFDRPYWRDSLMPVGRLREWVSGAARADAVIVTKCPPDFSQADRDRILREMDAAPHQRVFFSRYTYADPWLVLDPRLSTQLHPELDVLLITAIARVDYLHDYLGEQVREIHEMGFGDHHEFTKQELGRMTRLFREIDNPNKIILTTEKDAMRLYAHESYLREQNLPLFALPALVQFLPEAPGRSFDEYVRRELLAFRA